MFKVVNGHSYGGENEATPGVCFSCKGSGVCPDCEGEGVAVNEGDDHAEDCRSCDGTGRCLDCGGSGEA